MYFTYNHMWNLLLRTIRGQPFVLHVSVSVTLIILKEYFVEMVQF